jgi:hypothetical protein
MFVGSALGSNNLFQYYSAYFSYRLTFVGAQARTENNPR